MPATTAKLSSVAEVAGVLKQVQGAFANYQVARNEFVNALAGFLDRPDPGSVTLEALIKNDVMAVLCCPLISDPVSGIQASSLTCLSKLAAAEPLTSQVIVSCGALESIVVSMAHESAPVRASSDAVVTVVAKSGEEHAAKFLSAGVMHHLTKQLAEPTGAVREAAVKAVNALVLSGPQHAEKVCNQAMLETLVAMLKVNDVSPSLLKAVFSTFGNVATFSPVLATTIVQGGALPTIAQLLRTPTTSPDVRAAALSCLSQIAKHDERLAGEVAMAGALVPAVQSLTDTFLPAVRHAAAAVVLGIVSKTTELAEAAVKAGTSVALSRYLQIEAQGEGRLVGVMIAGQIASYNAHLAKTLVDANTVTQVVSALLAPNAEVASSAAWAVEQMALHGEDITMPVVSAGGLPALLKLYTTLPKNSSQFLKAKAALKAVVRNCTASPALEFLVDKTTPAEMLKHVLERLVPLLTASPKARQSFVTSGALMRMQGLGTGLHPRGTTALEAINELFPQEVVTYYRQ